MYCMIPCPKASCSSPTSLVGMLHGGVCVWCDWNVCGALCKCGSASLWEGVDVSMTLCVGVCWAWLHLHK